MKKLLFLCLVTLLALSSCKTSILPQEREYYSVVEVFDEHGKQVDRFVTNPYTDSKMVKISNHIVTFFGQQIQYPTSYTIKSTLYRCKGEQYDVVPRNPQKKFTPLVLYYTSKARTMHIDKNCKQLSEESGEGANIHTVDCKTRRDVQRIAAKHWECFKCMRNRW